MRQSYEGGSGPRERECEGDWMKKGRGEICACVCVHLSIGSNQIQKLLFLIHYIYCMNEIDSFGNWTTELFLIL